MEPATSPPAGFAEALDAVERLDPDAQAELVELARRRLAERGRAELVERVAEARRQLAVGRRRPVVSRDLRRTRQGERPA